jgi:hypothetical protein
VSLLRYLSLIALVGALALATVAGHVERTRLGYEVSELEDELARLQAEETAARLAYEQAVVPERLVEAAARLEVARPDELRDLTGARP